MSNKDKIFEMCCIAESKSKRDLEKFKKIYTENGFSLSKETVDMLRNGTVYITHYIHDKDMDKVFSVVPDITDKKEDIVRAVFEVIEECLGATVIPIDDRFYRSLLRTTIGNLESKTVTFTFNKENISIEEEEDGRAN